uniref:OCIA domain-containing protein n=1 Tax=Plectus sambesii TaxID=2011161 RepID=A0A914WD74_9BILA
MSMSNQPDPYGGGGSYTTQPSRPPSGDRAGYAQTSSGATNPLVQGGDDERREVLRRTLESLSSDQQKELMGVYKECSREVALTRALPFAGAVVASLYAAKKFLPPQLQMFGNRWPFYVATGMGAFIVGQLLTFDKCNDRAKEYLYRLSGQELQSPATTEYQMASETREMPSRDLTYDDLREQNREQYRKQVAAAARLPRSSPESAPRSSSVPYRDTPAPMSGTSGKSTTYGDEGFS